MKCDQVRDMLLSRLDGDGTVQPAPDLDEHLRECPACQAWYRRQQLAAAAIEKLAPIRVPTDFTARVLAHLPERKPDPRRVPQRRGPPAPTSLRQAWHEFIDRLGTPAGRRRLAPAFVMAAALLVAAVCILALAQGSGVPVTPGAATGSPAGMILAGAIAVLLLAVLGLLLLRHK